MLSWPVLDIVMLGSLQFIAFAGSDNPNIIYKNVGCGRKFRYDLKALEPTGSRRNYQGVAVGDFNLDGYPDIVSASGFVADSSKQYRLINHKSVLDKTAFFTETMNLVNNGTGWVWNGNTLENGDMMVQMNRQTDPSKCWVSIRPVGMQGVVSNGFVNRGALGATIIMRPKGRRAVMSPIIGGESFGSQHSSRRNFGLGRKCTGNVEILWPGGVRNRLYDVRHRETLILPEIPCDYMRNWETEPAYLSCVTHAVNKIVGKGYASVQFGVRLVSSATRARKEFVSQVRAGE